MDLMENELVLSEEKYRVVGVGREAYVRAREAKGHPRSRRSLRLGEGEMEMSWMETSAVLEKKEKTLLFWTAALPSAPSLPATPTPCSASGEGSIPVLFPCILSFALSAGCWSVSAAAV